MSDNEESNEVQPKKITREEADRLNNYAQGLDDEITHVVDYGGVLEDNKKQRKK